MLHFMRKHAKFFYVFFFLIIISFVFFYVGPVDKSGTPPLAVVKGEKLYVEEFWRAYDNMRESYREIYKDKFDAEMEKQLKLKETVLMELVSAKILYVAAKDMGLKVTDQELRDMIVNQEAFQRDGKFRQDVYLKTLQLNRLTPKYFEAKTREDLLVRKLRQLIEASVIVTEEELPQLGGTGNQANQLRDLILKQERARKKSEAVSAFVEEMKRKYQPVIRAELIA